MYIVCNYIAHLIYLHGICMLYVILSLECHHRGTGHSSLLGQIASAAKSGFCSAFGHNPAFCSPGLIGLVIFCTWASWWVYIYTHIYVYKYEREQQFKCMFQLMHNLFWKIIFLQMALVSYRVQISKVGVGDRRFLRLNVGLAEGVAGVSLWSWRCLFADAGEVLF